MNMPNNTYPIILNFQILAGKEEVIKLETFKQKRLKILLVSVAIHKFMEAHELHGETN